MPFFRRYRKYKGGKTGYRRRSYKKRSFYRPRSRFRRFSAGAKISSINQRIYAMLKKMDMRFRYHKPKFTLVEKRKTARRGPGRVTKAQLAAMAAIKLQAAKNVARMPRRAVPPPSDILDEGGDGMRISLESLPSLEQIAQQELVLEPMRASKRYAAAASILDDEDL